MLYSGKEKRYESHYMASDWGPSRKSSCPLYTNRTRPKLSSSSSPHKPTTILHPPARVRASHLPPLPKAAAGEWAQTPLPLAPGAPAALLDLLATLLASLSPLHHLLSSPLDFPWIPFDKNNVNLSTSLSSLSTPLFFSPPRNHQNGRQSKCDCITSPLKIPQLSVYTYSLESFLRASTLKWREPVFEPWFAIRVACQVTDSPWACSSPVT